MADGNTSMVETASSAVPSPFEAASRDNPHGTLTRNFTVEVIKRDAEGEEESDDRIAVAISSEAGVIRYDWTTGERYVEVLDHSKDGPDLSYAKDGLPFCLDHSLWAQVGLLEDLEIGDDRKLRGMMRKGNHPDADWLFADMKSGIRKKVSIGYWPGNNYEETKGKKKNEIATRRYKGWMLYEASSVAVPADYDVGTDRDARGVAIATEDVPAAADTARQEKGMDEDEITGGSPAATLAPPGPTREQQLAALAKEHKRGEDLISWIAEGLTVEQVRKALLAEYSARNAQPHATADAAPTVTTRERILDKPWEDAEFFRAVIGASRTPSSTDPRLLRGPAGQNIGVGSEGGFAVPEGLTVAYYRTMFEQGRILSRVSTRRITIGNKYSEVLVKEDARTDGNRHGGVRAFWIGEGEPTPVTKAQIRQADWNLKKLAAAVELTDEQKEDGPALVDFLMEAVPREMKFVAEGAVFEGDGVAKPLGWLRSGGVEVVPVESGQTIANTAQHIWVNAANMYAKLPEGSLDTCAFFMHRKLFAKVLTATSGTASSFPMFTPPGQLADAPQGAIYGIPIVTTEHASAEGTVGDFSLVDFSDYLVAQKGDIKVASSMHVEFLTGQEMLRFTFRLDGQPRTIKAVTPKNGTDKITPYITLAGRS